VRCESPWHTRCVGARAQGMIEGQPLAGVATRTTSSSEGQLRKIMTETPPDELPSALEQRFDEWEEKRPGKVAADYPVSLVCQTLAYPCSRYYHQAKGRDDRALREAIEEVAGTWPTYGSRRIAAQLRRQGWTVNRKHVVRIMSGIGLQRRIERNGVRPIATTRSHAFQIWCRIWRFCVQTTCGSATSPTSGSTTSSCIWQSSWTYSLAASGAGTWLAVSTRS